jgi:hypothetical protein
LKPTVTTSQFPFSTSVEPEDNLLAISATKKANEMPIMKLSFCLEVILEKAMAVLGFVYPANGCGGVDGVQAGLRSGCGY